MPGPTLPAIRRQFSDLPDEVRNHLRKLEPLLENGELDLSLAYLFMAIEQGRYRTMKCVLIRNLRCKTSCVDELLKERSFTRKSFREAVKATVGIDIYRGMYKPLGEAELIRDTIMHGRVADSRIKRQAIHDCLLFIERFGAKISSKTGKNPFGNLQGLTSRIKPLTNDQSIWIIRGVLEVSGVGRLSNPGDNV